MAPQDSQNCGRDFAKRKQTDAEFAANSLLRMVIIDIAINVLLSRVTRHPAGMHCPSWDDAFVSSSFFSVCLAPSPERRAFEGCIVRTRIALPFIGRFRRGLRLFFTTDGGATIFAKLRSKIAKIPKIGGKVCAHHFLEIDEGFEKNSTAVV